MALRVLSMLLGVFILFMGLDKIGWFMDGSILASRLQEWRDTARPIARWYIDTVALPGAPLFARVVPLAEIAAGSALILGFWTRMAAGMAFMMVVNIHVAADVIFRFGEERHSRRVARAIVQARERQPLTRTAELASVVRRAAGGRGWQRIDPATRTFQALRIWVNRELDGLDTFVEAAVAALRVGGRFAMIAFHSLEDRVVKQTFKRLPDVQILTKRPVVADEDEIRRNPRSRSARLRAVERVA